MAFTNLPPVRMHLAGGEHGLEAEHLVAGDAVLTARMPPALVATLPPRLAEFSPGNTG